MSEVTRILTRIADGDGQATQELLPLVYDELRRLAAKRMAQEKPGQTLQPTGLVHEAFIRLVDADCVQLWENRRHFFAAAAEAMRRIMVENARKKRRIKHGGEYQRVNVQVDQLQEEMDSDQLLALDAALLQLEEHSPIKARLVMLHFFGGMTMKQAADVLGISRATAHRYWVYARAWLFRRISGGPEEKST